MRDVTASCLVINERALCLAARRVSASANGSRRESRGETRVTRGMRMSHRRRRRRHGRGVSARANVISSLFCPALNEDEQLISESGRGGRGGEAAAGVTIFLRFTRAFDSLIFLLATRREISRGRRRLGGLPERRGNIYRKPTPRSRAPGVKTRIFFRASVAKKIRRRRFLAISLQFAVSVKLHSETLFSRLEIPSAIRKSSSCVATNFPAASCI